MKSEISLRLKWGVVLPIPTVAACFIPSDNAAATLPFRRQKQREQALLTPGSEGGVPMAVSSGGLAGLAGTKSKRGVDKGATICLIDRSFFWEIDLCTPF